MALTVAFVLVMVVLCYADETDIVCKSGNINDKNYNADKQLSKFGNYRYLFSSIEDSLYLLMKDSTSKRTFSNTFSKSALIEMELKQSTDKIINLLESAKKDTNHELTFKIGYGDSKKNITSFDKLSKSYVKGYALYISVSIDKSWFSAEYNFKLLEQERSEADVLRDIIEDMREEMDQLKQQKETGIVSGIVSWYTNGATGYMPMSGTHIEPTLDGMVTLSSDKKEIVIGIAGMYRISAELNWTACAGTATHQLMIYLNGNQVATKYAGHTGGFGVIERVFNLKQGDKVKFWCNKNYGTSSNFNSFTLQKL